MDRSAIVLTASAVGAVMALAGCIDREPAAPESREASELWAPDSAFAAERAGLLTALADAEARLVSGLSDPAAAGTLARDLGRLLRALESGRREHLGPAAADAQNALEAYAAGGRDAGANADAADVVAIRLVLDRVEALAAGASKTRQ